jgi:hypothetical protein
MHFAPNTRLSRVQDLLSTQLDQETVLMSIDAGAYYGLGGAAQSIWKILEVPVTFFELVDRLVKEYRVSPQTCTADLEPFLLKLEQEGLLRVE